jgi:hypothetical protein
MFSDIFYFLPSCEISSLPTHYDMKVLPPKAHRLSFAVLHAYSIIRNSSWMDLICSIIYALCIMQIPFYASHKLRNLPFSVSI